MEERRKRDELAAAWAALEHDDEFRTFGEVVKNQWSAEGTVVYKSKDNTANHCVWVTFCSLTFSLEIDHEHKGNELKPDQLKAYQKKTAEMKAKGQDISRRNKVPSWWKGGIIKAKTAKWRFKFDFHLTSKADNNGEIQGKAKMYWKHATLDPADSKWVGIREITFYPDVPANEGKPVLGHTDFNSPSRHGYVTFKCPGAYCKPCGGKTDDFGPNRDLILSCDQFGESSGSILPPLYTEWKTNAQFNFNPSYNFAFNTDVVDDKWNPRDYENVCPGDIPDLHYFGKQCEYREKIPADAE